MKSFQGDRHFERIRFPTCAPPPEGESALAAARDVLGEPGEPDETAEKALWNASVFLMRNGQNNEELTAFLNKIRTIGSPYSDRKAVLLRMLADPQRAATILSAAADQDTQGHLDRLISEIETNRGDARIPAKDTLVACFAVMSNADMIAAYRRKLSSIWF